MTASDPQPAGVVTFGGHELLGIYESIDRMLTTAFDAGSRSKGAPGLNADECVHLANELHGLLGQIATAYEWHTGRKVPGGSEAPFGWPAPHHGG